jgi:hypothetical protein
MPRVTMKQQKNLKLAYEINQEMEMVLGINPITSEP